MSEAKGPARGNALEHFIVRRPVTFWILAVVAASLPGQIPYAGTGIALVLLVGAGVWRHRAKKRQPQAVAELAHSRAEAKARTQSPPVSTSQVAPRPTAIKPQSRRPKGNGSAAVNVVGTQHYDGWGSKRGAGQARLVREPRNPHDASAIRVDFQAKKIGYLPRERAAVLAPMMDAGRQKSVNVAAHFEDYRVVVTLPHYFRANLEPHPQLQGLEPMEPWGRCVNRFEIEFEQDHRQDIVEVFRAQGVHLSGNSTTIKDAQALIVPSSLPNSPAVIVEASWVGNVVDSQFAPYHRVIHDLSTKGLALAVRADVWAYSDLGTVRSNVRISMPDVELIEPPGPLPTAPHVVLPPGSRIQVTGEERFLNEVAALLGGQPEQPVVAELYRLVKTGARTEKVVVGVRVYGDEVGELTPTSSAHFLPLLEACDEEGVKVMCRAVVKGNQLKADVVLDAKKGGELTDQWIEEHVYASVRQRLAEAPPAPQRADMWSETE